MASKYNWEPIEEMDMEDGTHTCYATQIGEHFIWITQISNNTWDVESKHRKAMEGKFVTLANCKTLTSAKRWVTRYL